MGFESQKAAESWAENAEFLADQLREEAMLRASPKLGIVAAVKQATEYDSDNWRLYVEHVKSKPGCIGGTHPPRWARWRDDRTHDGLDASVMRLCLDANDVIRNLYLRGE